MLNAYNVRIIYRSGNYWGNDFLETATNARQARNDVLNRLAYWYELTPQEVKDAVVGTITTLVTSDL